MTFVLLTRILFSLSPIESFFVQTCAEDVTIFIPIISPIM